jgi:hypothetical protein
MNANVEKFIGHEQAKGDNGGGSYYELRRQVKLLVDEHGAEDFLLAVVAGLDSTYREASDRINEVRLDLGYK